MVGPFMEKDWPSTHRNSMRIVGRKWPVRTNSRIFDGDDKKSSQD